MFMVSDGLLEVKYGLVFCVGSALIVFSYEFLLEKLVLVLKGEDDDYFKKSNKKLKDDPKLDNTGGNIIKRHNDNSCNDDKNKKEDMKNSGMKEVGFLIAEGMKSQNETLKLSIEIIQNQMEEDKKVYHMLLKDQERRQRELNENILLVLKGLQVFQEQSQGCMNIVLPHYDGISLEFEEWYDQAKTCINWNMWNVEQLLRILPVKLSGVARNAFEALHGEDKTSIPSILAALRKKLDPSSLERNFKAFMSAQINQGETISIFIDRCRMYLRRAEMNQDDAFAVEVLRHRVIDLLELNDKKVLKLLTKDNNISLDELIEKADMLLALGKRCDEAEMVNVVEKDGCLALENREDALNNQEIEMANDDKVEMCADVGSKDNNFRDCILPLNW